MKTIATLLFLTFFCCSLQGRWDDLNQKISKQVCKLKPMQLVMTGGKMNGIDKVNADYISFAPLRLNDARKLYLEIVDLYVEAYNSSEKIRPLLHHYPFERKDINLKINFVDREGKQREEDCVNFILPSEDGLKIFYLGYDAKAATEKDKQFIIQIETYEEATANNKQFSDRITSNTSSIHYVDLSRRLTDQVARQVRKSKPMQLVSTEEKIGNDIEEVTIKYSSFEALRPEQARKLYFEILDLYINAFNQSEIIKPYLHKFPFGMNNINLSIHFIDEDGNQRGGEYVNYMLHAECNSGNKMLYIGYDSVKNEPFALYTEPYEEALANNKRFLEHAQAK